jgi:hypothetical protein
MQAGGKNERSIYFYLWIGRHDPGSRPIGVRCHQRAAIEEEVSVKITGQDGLHI